ncbi:MAG: oligosaccharide flippase family protein [Proteobacteria bacterium]|nr:oligosaccharide flippase family protein [Pseudomonadota bacterium]
MLAVFRHALIFGLGPVLQKAASLVLLPLYTHHLDPGDYGEVEMLTLLVGLFVVVFCFDYRQGYIRALTKAPEPGAHSALISASVLLFGMTATAGAACFFLILPFFCDLMLGYRLGAGYSIILLVGLFADIVNFLLMATAQARLWSSRMVATGLLQFTIGTGLSVYLIVYRDAVPLGLFAGNAAGSLLMMAILLWMLRRDFQIPQRWRATVTPILAYSAPLLVGSLIYFVLRLVDRAVISKFLTLDDLGIYGMSWKLSGLLLTFMFLPFLRSFDVWRFRFYEEGKRTDDVAQIGRVFITGVAGAALLLATFGAEVFLLVADSRYASATILLPVLNAATLFQCCYTLCAASFFVTGATRTWLLILSAGMVVQVTGSIALVQAIGIQGAGISMLVSNMVIYAITAFLAPRYWRIPYRHGLFLTMIGAVTILSLGRTLLPHDNMLQNLAIDSLMVFSFLVFSCTLGAIRIAEVRQGIELSARSLHKLLGKISSRIDPGR